eukprot:2597405-Pyramimonas_sp.AAC.1
MARSVFLERVRFKRAAGAAPLGGERKERAWGRRGRRRRRRRRKKRGVGGGRGEGGGRCREGLASPPPYHLA